MHRVGSGLFRLTDDGRERPVRLICCPHVGGSARVFHGWPAIAGDAAEVLALTLPGRGIRVRERPLDDMNAIASALADDLAPLLDRPYLLFGHSMGGLVAYETTREVAQRGLPGPVALGISATAAPWLTPHGPARWQSDDEMLDRLRAFGATPEAAFGRTAAMTALLSAVRADFMACDTYRHPSAAPALDLTVLLWAGTKDSVAPVDQVRAWREIVTGVCELTRVPAGHFYLERYCGQIVHRLLDCFSERLLSTGGSHDHR
jgi:surfactin synthase thioesterase subunit